MIYFIVAIFLGVLALFGIRTSINNTNFAGAIPVIIITALTVIWLNSIDSVSIPNTIYIDLPNLDNSIYYVGAIIAMFIMTMFMYAITVKRTTD